MVVARICLVETMFVPGVLCAIVGDLNVILEGHLLEAATNRTLHVEVVVAPARAAFQRVPSCMGRLVNAAGVSGGVGPENRRAAYHTLALRWPAFASGFVVRLPRGFRARGPGANARHVPPCGRARERRGDSSARGLPMAVVEEVEDEDEHASEALAPQCAHSGASLAPCCMC